MSIQNAGEAAPPATASGGVDGSHGGAHPANPRFLALTVGSIGVVFGDIGTSPIYAMREALAHTRGASELAVLGVVSLVFWALMLIVTVKYVVLVMRADNKGEGGTLALMALAQHALGRRSIFIFSLGIIGASLFYGDGLITPAISVLSAAEGLKDAPAIGHLFTPYVLPLAGVILIALFMVQSRGAGSVGRLFGPITLAWFVVLGALGLAYVVREPSILRGLSPYYGVRLLAQNGLVGFAILGSVFLAVTGAEALYADMGHFGRGPIRAGWLVVAFPCLTLNYLGQGALVLLHPAARDNPFFEMIPAFAYWPVLALTTAATVIASQAVITGAFSMTQQAVQLGFIPRMEIRRTSETVAGQIFVPQVNMLLMIGVLFLLAVFKSSSNLAAAYGIAVTATMVTTVLLFFVIERKLWRWPLWACVAVVAPFLVIDTTFLAANAMKFIDGGWFPVALGAGLILIMGTWIRGVGIMSRKVHRDSIPLSDLVETLSRRPPFRVAGTAVFLTSDPEVAPAALLHNLKHNKALHQKNIILTVRTADTPRVDDANRVTEQRINDDFSKVTINCGFMESPNVPRALTLLGRRGPRLEIMSTSFFLGRRTVIPAAHTAMPLWQDRLFIFLLRNAANPTDFFQIPAGRVVELGTQVSV